MPVLLKALEYAPKIMAEVIKNGDTAIDATCGNGKDTLFLAERVGVTGKVYAFDIQETAIRNTYSLLEEKGLQDRVVLFREGHEKLDRLVNVPINAAMFNLGYLPGGNHSLTTKAAGVIKALEGIMPLLLPGGLISIVVYPGHPAGEIEKNTLENMLSELDQRKFSVIIYRFINQKNNPPELIIIEKNPLS